MQFKCKFAISAVCVLAVWFEVCLATPYTKSGNENQSVFEEPDTEAVLLDPVTTITPFTETTEPSINFSTSSDDSVSGEITSDIVSTTATITALTSEAKANIKGQVLEAVSFVHTASSPSIQLAPPPPAFSFRTNNIPITLLSIAGNSGGTTGNSRNANDIHVDFSRFRYHVETGQLEQIGNSTGVCPENMRFFAVPGNGKSGTCDCDYYQCSRPLIYSQERNQCFWAWSQGPCEKGEWFIFDKDLKKQGKCTKNPCSELPTENHGSLLYIFQNPDDKACYEAGTQGYCTDSDERLLIYPGEPIPKCRKFALCYPLSVPQELQCVYGNKYYYEGKC